MIWLKLSDKAESEGKIMNFDKKCVFIRGNVLLPLVINHKAVIYHGSSCTRTSPVVSIRKVTQKYVLFETQNSNYCVSLIPASEMAAEPGYAGSACA